MRLRGKFDAHAHAGEQQAGNEHPQGLHGASGKKQRRRILPRRLHGCIFSAINVALETRKTLCQMH
jgi:hypothetical protein